MKLTDQQHPFYKPLWRRVAIVAAIAAWFAYEAIFVGEPFWLAISGGVLAYGLWTFLWNWPGEPDGPKM